MAKAIAAYDLHKVGLAAALSPAAQRGLVLFEGRAGCAKCHSGFNFTDEGFHNIGVGMDKEPFDVGRYELTRVEANKGAFKTPTLRDIALRSPYMHDGSQKTLKDVVEFYNRGGIANPWLSREIEPLNLSEADQADLVAFLDSLTGEIAPEVLARPVLPPDDPG